MLLVPAFQLPPQTAEHAFVEKITSAAVPNAGDVRVRAMGNNVPSGCGRIVRSPDDRPAGVENVWKGR